MFEKRLKRKTVADKFYGYHYKNNINDPIAANKYLDMLIDFFNKYKFKSDDNFIMAGRKKFIYDEVIEILNGIKKVDNPIYFVLGSLEEFISNPNQVYFEDVDKSKWKQKENGQKYIDGKDLAELRAKNGLYSVKGYICLEEKQYILNFINDIKKYLNCDKK